MAYDPRSEVVVSSSTRLLIYLQSSSQRVSLSRIRRLFRPCRARNASPKEIARAASASPHYRALAQSSRLPSTALGSDLSTDPSNHPSLQIHPHVTPKPKHHRLAGSIQKYCRVDFAIPSCGFTPVHLDSIHGHNRHHTHMLGIISHSMPASTLIQSHLVLLLALTLIDSSRKSLGICRRQRTLFGFLIVTTTSPRSNGSILRSSCTE